VQLFHLLKRFGIILFLLAAIQTAFSQSYLVHNYTYRNGLPSSEVYDIVQDSTGVLWLGSRNGLLRYDGNSWQQTRYDPSGAYRSCFDLEIDVYGKLWVTGYAGPKGGRLFRLNGESWEEVAIPIRFVPITGASGQLYDLHLTYIDGFISPWLAIRSRGLFYMDNQKNWQKLTVDDGLIDNSIFSIKSIGQEIYLASKNGIQKLTYRRSDSSFDMEIVRTTPSWGIAVEFNVRGVEASGLKRLWTAGPDGVCVWEQGVFKRLSGPIIDLDINTVKLEADYLGGCYVGSNNTIHYVSVDGELEELGTENGLLTSNTTNMFLDREGLLWFCSYKGVSKLVSRRFSSYNRDHGLFASEVTAVNQFTDGRMVFGHNWGFTIWSKDDVKTVDLQNLQSPELGPIRVMQLLKAPGGNLVASTAFGGVIELKPDGSITQYSSPYNEERGAHHVAISIAYDKTGRLIVGMIKGAYELKDGVYTPVYVEEFAEKGFRFIKSDRFGNLLFCTLNNGIYHETPDGLMNYRHPTDSFANMAYTVYQCPDNGIWVGTWAGIFLAKDGQLIRHEKMPDINTPVFFIFQDSQETVWIGGDQGIWRWKDNTLNRFGLTQGLVGLETNRGAGFMDSKKNLWFGTNNGVAQYHPIFDNVKPVKPLLTLTNLIANDEKYPLDKPINLSYTYAHLGFRFISGSFSDEKNLTFRYQLEGFDDDWQTLNRRPDNQEFHYSSLPSGTYRFYLQTQNANGDWSPIVVSETITIAVPYWETWWFMTGSILLPIVLLAGYFHYRSQRKYSAQLEREVHERTNQLRLSEQRYKQLFDESRDVVFISTPDGWFLDMNPAGLDLFEVDSLDELRSLNIKDNFYVNPDDRHKYIAKLSRQGYLQDYEIKMRTSSGKQLTILETANAVRGRNGLLQFRGIMRDVTKQRTMERQLVLAEKMEAVGLMASGIAHDFNNLLSGILGYASLLKLSFRNGSEEHGYVETIEDSAHSAAGLTEQLMGFAQQNTYRIEPLNLNTIIADTIKLFKRTFDRSIDIRLNLNPEVGMVSGDEAQLQRVIVNLGINSRDAMPDGGMLQIKTSMKQLEPVEAAGIGLSEGSYVCMEISDTGIGIDSLDKEHIFEPFFTTKEAGKGTGLGLAMVYSAVNSHGGAVQVDSEVGSGTTFRIFLPGTDAPQVVKSEKLATPKTGSETILVVDDEEHVRSLLKHSLERYGYKTILAETGLEALSQLQKHTGKVSLVILDMIMPKMNGSEALKKLRDMFPDMPVLIATGYPGDGKEAVDIQNEEILKKPFKVSELLQRVRTILDGEAGKNGSH